MTLRVAWKIVRECDRGRLMRYRQSTYLRAREIARRRWLRGARIALVERGVRIALVVQP